MCPSSCPLIVTSMAINHRELMTEVKRPLRIAGALYLLVVVLGGVAQLAARAGIRLPGAATSARQHMDAQPATFQVTLVADIAMAALFVSAGIALYLLFRHIDRNAAGATVIYVAVGVGMILVNLLFRFAALLGEADPFHQALGAQTSGGLVERLLDMHDHGYTIAGVFFGLCLLPLGYLAYQSSRIPRVLSTLLAISLILDTLLGLLWPDLPALIHTLVAPPPVADLWLILLMVAKGGLGPRRARTAVAPVRADQAAVARPTPSCDVSQAESRTDGQAPVALESTTGSSRTTVPTSTTTRASRVGPRPPGTAMGAQKSRPRRPAQAHPRQAAPARRMEPRSRQPPTRFPTRN